MAEPQLGKIAAIFVGSVIVLVRQIDRCGGDYDCSHYKEGYENWTWACSIGSVVFTLIILIMAKFAPGKLPFQNFIAIFLLLWWIGGTGCMTFEHPYKTTGNGYFGAWLALIAAWLNCVDMWPQMQEPFSRLASAAGSKWMALLLLASATVVVQSSVDCDNRHKCDKQHAWMVACSVISLVVVIALLIPPVASAVQPFAKYVMLFLFAWWCAGAGVATFDAPYKGTGNGYFGVWAALISASILCSQAWGAGVESAGAALEKGAGAAKSSTHLFGLFVCSVVTLAAASIACDDRYKCEKYYAWAVACTAISTFITLVLVVLNLTGKDGMLASFMKWIALFLFVWWVAGAWTMTFKRPFKYAGNGYFATWGALLFSCLLVAEFFGDNAAVGAVQGQAAQGLATGERNKRVWLLLAVTSLALGVQSAMDCDDYDCKHGLPWAVACSWVSFVLAVVVFFLFDKVAAFVKWIALFAVLWWMAGAGYLTFSKPYVTTSTANGYFLTWASFVAAGVIACGEFGIDAGGVANNFGGGGGGGGGGSGAMSGYGGGGGQTSPRQASGGVGNNRTLGDPLLNYEPAPVTNEPHEQSQSNDREF
eukprot:Hpha_TRINITY_DN15607_c0_g4::TRINITY_DN15607_c0_g4_i1::g.99511::m.99511